jgi:LPS sulfotransferase NodH
MKMKINDIPYKVKRYQIRIDDWLLAKKVVVGQQGYQKFVILTRARTGSNFLVSLLQSHPQIRAFEELFPKLETKIHWGYPNYPRSAQILNIREEEPLRFLEDIVFREFPKAVSAVGFKLFYYQAQGSNKQQVWDYLRQNRDIKIIHLKRKNLLQVCLSYYLAKTTNQWILKQGSQLSDSGSINLNYNDCLQLFEETRRWEHDSDLMFAEHPKIEVTYEDLVADTAGQSKSIQAFLGVKPQSLSALTLRQNTRALSERIANYPELKQQFEGTPWYIFFTD